MKHGYAYRSNLTDADFHPEAIEVILEITFINRYRTVWGFIGHANSRARISV